MDGTGAGVSMAAPALQRGTFWRQPGHASAEWIVAHNRGSEGRAFGRKHSVKATNCKRQKGSGHSSADSVAHWRRGRWRRFAPSSLYSNAVADGAVRMEASTVLTVAHARALALS